MSSDNSKSGIRRKDYVAKLAVGLFLFILIFELLLVTWLPSKLITKELWDKEVALQELIRLEDTLRGNLGKSLKFENKWQEGEAHMALDCLNEIAKYIREHQADMTREQIGELYRLLKKFENRYNRWNNQKYSISFENIDINPLLEKELENYKNVREKKTEIKTNHILFRD